MSFDLPSWSRYRMTDKILSNINTFGLYKMPDGLKNIEIKDLINIKIDAKFAGRPDLISQDQYGTPYYAWVIVMHNAPLNPFGWPRNGDLISIPNQAVITDVIG